MNGPFRLLENFHSKVAGASLQQPFDVIEGHEFALRFVDASLAIDADALDREPPTETPFEKEEPDMLSPGQSEHPEPEVGMNEPVIIAFGQGENGSPAPFSKGQNIPDEILSPSEAKASYLERGRNQIEPDMPKGILRIGQSRDEQPTAKLLVPTRTMNDQKIETDFPFFENAIPRDQKSLLDNHSIKSVGEESAMKMDALGDASASVFRAVLPINQTLSPMASLSPTDIASVAPTVSRPTAATAPPLPTLDTMIDDQWVARLGQEIGKLTGEKTSLSFQLKPQNLGKLHVQIMSDAAGNIVRVDTDSEIAKQLILGAQGRLEQDIRLNGSKLVRVDVTHQEQSGHQSQDAQGRGPTTERGEYLSPDESLADPSLPATTRPDGPSSHLGARYA